MKTKLNATLLTLLSIGLIYLVYQNILPWQASIFCLVPLYVALAKKLRKFSSFIGALWLTLFHAISLYGIAQISQFTSLYLVIAGMSLLIISYLSMYVLQAFKISPVIAFIFIMIIIATVGKSTTFLGVYANPVSLGYLLVDSSLIVSKLNNLVVLDISILLTNALIYKVFNHSLLTIMLPLFTIFIPELPQAVPSAASKNQNIKSIRIGLIQPSIKHRERELTYENLDLRNKYTANLNKEIATIQKADLIVLGEAALPGILSLDEEYGTPSAIPILSGVIIQDFDKYYTSVVEIYSSRLNLIYNKRSLVPILETSWLSTEILKPVYYLKSKNINIGVLICKDALYPDILQDVMKFNPDMLIVFTNTDTSFGFGLQIRAIRLRAVESRKTILVVNQSGGSVVINKYGRIVESLPWNLSTAQNLNVAY